MKTARDYWAEAFAKIEVMIEYNPKWANGTGYFDHAVKGEHAPKLQPGEMVKAEVPAPNLRRIIIVGTRFGNVVVFERFSPDGGDRSNVIVANYPRILERAGIIKMNRWTADDILMYLDASFEMYNIGRRVEEFAEDVMAQSLTEGGLVH